MSIPLSPGSFSHIFPILIFHASAQSLQSCLTLCNSMDCSPPGSSVHGILPATILKWVAISFSRRSSWPRDWTCISCISCIGRQILYPLSHWEASHETVFLQITTSQDIDYILCSQRWRSSIKSAKTRPGADCGSDHELLIAKFRLKLKKESRENH